MNLTIKNTRGEPAGELLVGFQLVENGKGTQAVHDVVVAYQANQRRGTACTKTMGEVAGTGKKPWRQKGTGRARAGSFRSPLWVGGGVVFGPKPRDFSQKVPRSTRTLALRKALSARLAAGDVVVVDALKLAGPKTRELTAILAALQIKGSALLVCDAQDQNLRLASRNIADLGLTTGSSLNTYEVLRYAKVIFTRPAFAQVEERLK